MDDLEKVAESVATARNYPRWPATGVELIRKAIERRLNAAVEIAHRACFLANERGGDYTALSTDEICQLLVDYENALLNDET